MFRTQKLDNGIPLLLEHMDGLRSVAMGIWVLAGSRYERPEKNGISHFLEHMFFKGTKKRSAQDIAIAIDSIGAELNAFTSKENTAFYIKVMDESIDEGLELLFDIFTESEFPEEELKREQSVVCEEISMVLDTPDDLVHDLFSADLWGGDALGQPILGSEDTVRSFSRDDLRSYASSAYGTDRIVISCAGNFNMDRIGSMIGDALGVSTRTSTVTAPKPSEFIPGLRVHKKDLAESHVCLGIKGIEQNSPDRYKALLLNTIFGGGISSRLFQEIRAKRGLAYSVYSFLSSYTDTGVWGIYAGTASQNVNKVIDTASKELAGLSSTVNIDELERAKRQLKASVMFGLESSSRRMQSLANQQIFYGRYYAPEEILAEIDAVALDDVRELAGRLVSEGRLAITVLGAAEESEVSGGVSALSVD